ncbi:MAG TPA: hypothetical protein VKV74_12745 [Bryobacteraceae bacterium]|nr:hypothetical protein [Bryobacteraceae bacterium]
MTRGWNHLAGVRRWLVSLILMAACLAKYQPWSALQAARGITITSEALRVAHNLSRSAKFADPFGTLPTGSTAHLAPGFPILVAALLKVFGEGAAGSIALAWLPILALSLQIALFPSLAKMLGYSPWTGVMAAIFALLTKPITYEQWEPHEAGLLIFVLAALMCRRANPWLTGAMAGVTICFQPIMALVYLAWVLLGDRRRIAPLLAVPALVCSPWALRNQLRLATPEMRDNLGIELYVSFNDCAPYGFEQSQKHGCFGRFHPNQNLAEALAVRAMGEAPYNRDRMRKAFAWIAHHPRRAGVLIAERIVAFWFPPNDRFPEYLQIRKRRLFFFWVLTLASFAGVWLSLRRRIAGAPFLAALLVIYPLVYYVVQFDHRYRYPILWATWLAAASLFERFFAHAAAPLSPDVMASINEPTLAFPGNPR